MEPIFTNYELRKQLQTENVKFMAIDFFFKSTMRQTRTGCVDACTNGLLEKFRLHNRSLELLIRLFSCSSSETHHLSSLLLRLGPAVGGAACACHEFKALQPHIRNLFDCVQNFSYPTPGTIDGIIGTQGRRLTPTVKSEGLLSYGWRGLSGISNSLRRQMRITLNEFLAQQAASKAQNLTNSGRGVHPVASSLEWMLEQTFPSQQCLQWYIFSGNRLANRHSTMTATPAFRKELDGVKQSLTCLCVQTMGLVLQS